MFLPLPLASCPVCIISTPPHAHAARRASRCTSKEAAPSAADISDDSADLDKCAAAVFPTASVSRHPRSSSRETDGDVGDTTLVKRIFYSDDVTRKEGVLAHTLQKIDVTGAAPAGPPLPSPTVLFSGKVLNPDREEIDDEVRALAVPPPNCMR
jgi:hypothetical protein